ncbi:hypothetical protein K3722_05035 [Leisingera caerulea]|uniref:Uncharacterized protein n=1 Tax=Leisingera caerulea TaxID=506591 RepID=A0A9Q9HIA8_LEICA|nr:hypothetical protein [Leisingera caerulea]UWQ50798.1 hypothetical protein K3720_05165 [Leisingera caerulea]UWQ54866.1 hypothetical protein K3721_04865 [Leisingera caerulea]UWQ59494.1 hypothetical protein K3722_05035 [Leisingera caerulea]UWQ63620.1 hypothetical protein K3723_04825 [Leisingera caerulea]
MAEAFLIALATLVIVLYGQTRLDARAIRRNRGTTDSRPLVLSPRNR